MKFAILSLISIFLTSFASVDAQSVGAVKQSSDQLKSAGFDIYQVERSDGSKMTCYLTNSKEKLPLIVNIDGSGAASAFRKMGDRINGGMTGYLASVASGKAHVLVVEKPGVSLFDDDKMRTPEGATREFLEKYTLEYMIQSHAEATRAILRLPHVSADKILLFGISDGGQLVSELSANLPETTHVAALASGGPTQIFDFVTFASRPLPDDKPGDAQQRIEEVYQQWAAIQNEPQSIEKFWYGHPYRRWASFCKSSPTNALLKTKAKIYVAQGTEDKAVPIESFDVLVSTLRTSGKTLVAERLDGLNHNFRKNGETGPEQNQHLDRLIERIMQWWKA